MRQTHWKGTTRAGIVLLCAIALLVGATPVTAAPDENLDLALCARDENTFTLNIDNSYFPLPVGQQWVYSGQEQGTTLGLRITVLDDTETLYTGRRKSTRESSRSWNGKTLTETVSSIPTKR